MPGRREDKPFEERPGERTGDIVVWPPTDLRPPPAPRGSLADIDDTPTLVQPYLPEAVIHLGVGTQLPADVRQELIHVRTAALTFMAAVERSGQLSTAPVPSDDDARRVL
ncbi:hypothetical protein [Streptosporangium lutulentum]|uniref:Uncharacterized protein n=1 Tax=Streptosporangium lutulentum TaxID=1461250 RepID=A0ABT9QUP7_9ACTN|nr:hypothetical protein [Streptosporangium lutulentum]MDP9850462.1 hypothetical protein [Streptosporangium lutulentum]